MGKLDNIRSFSIKNFIADMPRMLNESFSGIKDAIESFYSENGQNTTIHATNLKATDRVEANTIMATQYATKSGKIIDFNAIEGDFSEIEAKIEGKVDKVDGKGLSTNDFTDEDKAKLDTLDASVVHTYGEEVINGAKTFKSGINMSGTKVRKVKDPDAADDAANKRYVDSAVSGKYTKPSNGIPETDLERSIQNKISTGVTSYTIATSAADKANSAYNLASSKYAKPTTGIPGSDLDASITQKINDAYSIATDASTAAAAASLLADMAYTTAEGASGAAGSAHLAADDAADAAAAAQRTANDASAIAADALSTANSALEAAETAAESVVLKAGEGARSITPKVGDTHAYGLKSVALGQTTVAGNPDKIISDPSDASRGDEDAGYAAFASGIMSTAKGRAAFAEGENCEALAAQSHAEGNHTKASGKVSHAEGSYTQAIGEHSHAEGHETAAVGKYSHSEGNATKSNGDHSHAEGKDTVAGRGASHAEGLGTQTGNIAEHAEGKYNKSNTNTIHSVGIGTSATSRKNAQEILTNGDTFIIGIGGYDGTNTADASSIQTVVSEISGRSGSSAVISGEGTNSIKIDGESASHAYGKASVSIGHKTITGDASHVDEYSDEYVGYGAFATGLGNKAASRASSAEGQDNEVGLHADQSHVEGSVNKISGIDSMPSCAAHAEGSENVIENSSASHAEGFQNKILTAVYAHVEGWSNVIKGMFSHAEGRGTTTNNTAEHAEGQYNKSNKNSGNFGSAGNTQHSIGIGNESKRMNAFEVMQNGDVYILGIGGYDGTNAGAPGILTIQQVINQESE